MNHFLDKSVTSTTFIGRKEQLAAVDRWVTQVEKGGSRVVLVAGEAGIGKSRLVTEVHHLITPRGWQAVQGRCFEPDVIFPFAPLIDLLRTYFFPLTAIEVSHTLGPLAREVVKLLPELALTLPNLVPTPQLDPEAEKRRLFEALIQFFVNLIHSDTDNEPLQHETAGRASPNALSTPRPLLLILEDLHWCDDTSLEFLRYLARRLATQPVLFLLTYRTDEVHISLQHFLSALSHEQRPVDLNLPRLTRPEVDALLRSIFELERPVRAEFRDAVMGLTHGNPFFVEEVLKALIAEGDLFYIDGEWERKPIDKLRIPYSIQDAVQRRSEQLTESARYTLTVAAVIGQQFDFEVLQAITNCSEAELLSQIKELLAAQLVIELSTEHFAFRHALTRQAIYSSLLVRERQRLHQQIGENLERRTTETVANSHMYPTTVPSADLAYHYYTASMWEKALTYAHRSGVQAQALYTPRAAIEQFTRAIEAAKRLNEAVLLPDLYRERGLAYETVGDFKPARSDLENALQLVRSSGDRQGEWQGLLDLGKLWVSRDYNRAGDYFQRALELARTLGKTDMLARSLNQMGNWHLNVGASQQALTYHEEALALFRGLNDESGLAQTFDLLGMSNLLSGDPVQGAAYCKQAAEYFAALNDRQRLSSSLTTLIVCGPVYTTDTTIPADINLAESVHWGEQAVQVADEIGWRAGKVYAMVLSGQNLAVRGKYGQALDLMHRSLEIAEEIEHYQWMCLVHREVGRVYLDLMTLPKARRHLEQSLTMAKEIGSSFHAQRSTGNLISLLIVEHQFKQAESLLNTMGDLGLAMQTLAQRLIWRGRAELALATGDNDSTLQIVKQLFASASNTENQDTEAIPYLAKLRGEALASLRRWSEAETALLAALKSACSQNIPWMVWRIHVALGKLYRAQKQYIKADQAYANARTVIDEIAATISEPEIRDNFVYQANTMMSPPKPLTPLQLAKQASGGLTRRECEVAVLVADGQSNREIAEILVVGVRTIEGHVSNILGKLNFASRTEIAVWVMENGLLENGVSRE